MQNAVSAGQVPGIEHDLPHPDFFCLSLHAQLEKRLLSVDIDRLSSKPKLSKGESGLSQSSSGIWKMKEIASQEDIHPTSWKERWGSSWGAVHSGSSWFSQAVPVHPCQRLCPPASPDCAAAGMRPGTGVGDSVLYQASWRQTDSNQLPSKQANEAQPSAKKSTLLEMQGSVL